MLTRRLLPILLVLLQSGLTVAHAHTHSDRAEHSGVPHLHLCELLELFTTAHEHDHDGDDHDADAVDLSDMMSAAAPPAGDVVAIDLSPAEAGPACDVPVGSTFPIGLPPSTAGPSRPLYLTFCSLTI